MSQVKENSDQCQLPDPPWAVPSTHLQSSSQIPAQLLPLKTHLVLVSDYVFTFLLSSGYIDRTTLLEFLLAVRSQAS